MEEIGANIVINPGEAVATLEEVTAAADRLNAALLRLGEVSTATMGKVDAAAAGTAAATDAAAAGAAKSGVAAEDAALVGAGAAGKQTKAVNELGAATEKTSKKAATLSEQIAGVGEGFMGKLGRDTAIGALGVIGESIDQYIKYQKAMTQLVTQAGLPANRLAGIMAGGLDIGKQTGLNFNDIANQLYRIVSATSGLKETNKQILALGKSAADIAVLFNVAPGAPTEQVARLFGSLANAGRSGKLQQVGSTPAQMAALLNAAVGTGDIRGQDLIGALGRGVLQSGQAVHAKLPDILAWLDLSTRLGAQPSSSGTLIAHSLQQIATPSEQGTLAQQMIGIQQGQLRGIIQSQGIGPAINFLMAHMAKFAPLANYPATSYGGKENAPGAPSAYAQLEKWGMNPSLLAAFQAGDMTKKQTDTLQQFLLTKMFGGARQEIPVLSIAENPQLYADIERQIRAQANMPTYNRDLKTALGTPAQQLKIAEQNLRAYSIELGKDFTPILLKAVHGIVAFASFLSTHRIVLDGLGAIFGSIAAIGLGAFAWAEALKVIKGVQSFITVMAGLSNKAFGTSFGTTGAVAEQTGAITANTEAVVRLTEVMGGNDMFYSPYGRSGSLEQFYAGTNGARVIGSGEQALTNEEFYNMPPMTEVTAGQGATTSFLSGLGSKLIMGGMAAGISTMLYNTLVRGTLAKHIGTPAASALGDVITGGVAGGTIAGPWGALIGALGGLTIALRHSKLEEHVIKIAKHLAKSDTTKDVLKYGTGLFLAQDAYKYFVGPALNWFGSLGHHTPTLTPLQKIAMATVASAKAGEHAIASKNLLSADLYGVDLDRSKYGANSGQYKQAMKTMMDDAMHLLGKEDDPFRKYGLKANTLTAPIIAELVREANAHMTARAEAKYFENGIAMHNAQLKLFYASGGTTGSTDLSRTKAEIAQERAFIKADRGMLSTQHLKSIEDRIKQQLEHEKQLENDMKAVTKSTDVHDATRTLEAQVKSTGISTNDLLAKILNILQVAVGPNGKIPTGTPLGNVARK